MSDRACTLSLENIEPVTKIGLVYGLGNVEEDIFCDECKKKVSFLITQYQDDIKRQSQVYI